MYDPQNKRFMAQDIVQSPYVMNNPKTHIDSSGEFPIMLVSALIGGAIGGIASAAVSVVAQATSAGGFSLDNVEWGTAGTAALTGAALTVAGTAVVGVAMTTGSGILARP